MPREDEGPSPQEMGLDDKKAKQDLLASKSELLGELEMWAKQGDATSVDRERITKLREEVRELKAELGPETGKKPKLELESDVFVQRSSGKIENGWKVSAYSEGSYIVTKLEGNGLMKSVPAAELEALQEKQKSDSKS